MTATMHHREFDDIHSHRLAFKLTPTCTLHLSCWVVLDTRLLLFGC
jgi:hypothetical protein